MPQPVQLPDHLQRNFRTSWMDSVLGASLVLLLLVAACAGGFVLIRTVWTNPEPVHREPEPTADAQPATDTPAAPDTPPMQKSLLGSPGQPIDREVRLIGTWESRADDGSSSLFIFFPNGKIVIAPVGERQPLESKWYLVEQQGEDTMIEVGPECGMKGNFRFSFHVITPDAFTLSKTIHNGIVHSDELRYIRVGPPRELSTPSVKIVAEPPPQAPKPAEKLLPAAGAPSP
jgi:hypothetical protein